MQIYSTNKELQKRNIGNMVISLDLLIPNLAFIPSEVPLQLIKY